MKKIVVLVLMLIVGTGSLFANYDLKKGDTIGIAHVIMMRINNEIKKDHPDYDKWSAKTETIKDTFNTVEEAVNFILKKVGADNILEFQPLTFLGGFIGYNIIYKK